MKCRVAAAAGREDVTESVWLKRLIVQALLAGDDDDGEVDADSTPGVAELGPCDSQKRVCQGPCSHRVYVRLRPEDRLLLEARAAARGMRSATYVSALTRSHLRHLAPLPKNEYLALRQSINELSAIGRNVNQIAKYAHEGGRLPPSLQRECWAMLKVCEGLRDHTKALLKANLDSWRNGQADSGM